MQPKTGRSRECVSEPARSVTMGVQCNLPRSALRIGCNVERKRRTNGIPVPSGLVCSAHSERLSRRGTRHHSSEIDVSGPQPKTLTALGERFGVSRERIRQNPRGLPAYPTRAYFADYCGLLDGALNTNTAKFELQKKPSRSQSALQPVLVHRLVPIQAIRHIFRCSPPK